MAKPARLRILEILQLAAFCTLLMAAPTRAQRADDAAAPAPKTSREGGRASKRTTIRHLLERVAALETQVAELTAAKPAEHDARETRTAATVASSPADRQEPSTGDAAGLMPTPEDQNPLIQAAFQRTLIERGGLLLPPRTIDIDTAVRYVNSSSERIVIDGFTILPVLVVGDIVSERVRRDFTEVAATARFGLPHDLQVDIRVPYARQKQNVITAESQETADAESGFGDAEIALSRQLRHSGGKGPDLLGSLRLKTTTGENPLALDGALVFGTGYPSLTASVTAVKVLDPAVLFGGLSYTKTYSAHTQAGELSAGNSYGFNVGLAIALNLDTSLSFAYEQQFVRRSYLDAQAILGSDLSTGVFSIGASIGRGDSSSLNFSMGAGVTEDSPDLVLSFSAPLRKRLQPR